MLNNIILLSLSLLAAASRAQAASAYYGVFPRSNEVFHNLLADPREIQLSASYYRFQGRHTSDVALGHSWGMARWQLRQGSWITQWNLEAMAYSRFRLGGSINEFETIDFFANLPVEVRHDIYSAKFKLYHESSHLGDDYIRRTGNSGFRYSQEGLRSVFSVEPASAFRFYGGGTYLLHSIPYSKRWAAQTGVEFKTPDLGLFEEYPCSAFLAQDFQARKNVKWNVNSHSVAGLRFGFKGSLHSMRVQISRFEGHSPYGQFFNQFEHYTDVGISFDF